MCLSWISFTSIMERKMRIRRNKREGQIKSDVVIEHILLMLPQSTP